jgi:hypothetical protein
LYTGSPYVIIPGFLYITSKIFKTWEEETRKPKKEKFLRGVTAKAGRAKRRRKNS